MKVSYILSIGAVVALVTGGLAAVGLNVVPNITTDDELRAHAEHEERVILELAGSVILLDQRVTLQALESSELRALQLKEQAILRRQECNSQGKTSCPSAEVLEGQVRILERRNRQYQIKLDKIQK